MRCALALVAAGVALIPAGCGGDEEEVSGPAAVTPAGAPVYVDVSVRPEGDAAEDAEAAAGRILGTDEPGQRIVELVERAAAADGVSLDYAEEIEPWLGERFAVFLTAIGGGGTESKAAFVVETTDVDEALGTVRSASDLTGRTAEHEGVEYEFDDEGDVVGAVDEFIVGGDEAAFKAAVDASRGEALAESDQFEGAVETLADDRLATLYVPPTRFIGAIKDPEFDREERRLLRQALGDAADKPVVGELTASAEAITIELAGGAGGAETEESELLSRLPGEAWLAVGLSDLGGSIGDAVKQLDRGGVRGLDGAAVRRELLEQTGIELDHEVIGALGDAALFVEGSSSSSLGGALVIESKDPEASAELIGKLEDLVGSEVPSGIRVEPLASTGGDQGFQISDPGGGLPQAISVIQREKRIVVGYGGAAVNQALAGADGADPLSENPAFEAARRAVGDLGLDAFLSLDAVIALAREAGAASEPGFEEVRPYLDALRFLAVGSGSESDRTVLRLVIGLAERAEGGDAGEAGDGGAAQGSGD